MIRALQIYCLFLSIMGLLSCSATKPAPIKDQSSNVTKSKQVTVPNWSVSDQSKPIPVKKESATSKPVAPPQTKAEPKQKPVDEKTPIAKQENYVPDPAFRIAKPSKSETIEAYNGTTNKGIDYLGKMGDPVSAAADGKVIFAGNSLRSYGNLVIVKHNNSYITVYAHNKSLLVKEGDTVLKGQKIAEMGNSEADKVNLHFELRRDSKPIDPSGYFE